MRSIRRQHGLASLLGRATLFGVTAGLRSQLPGALLALNHERAPRGTGWRHWPVLRSQGGRLALVGSALGEIVSDKLPVVPPRTRPGPLAGRVAFGGLAGAAIGSGHGTRRLLFGTAAGALGALAGSYAGETARTRIGEQTDLPDPLVALGEDALAVGLGLATLRG